MRRGTVKILVLSIFLSLVLLDKNSPVGGSTVLDIDASTETRYGAHIDLEGWVHFVVHAPDADGVNLLLFENADDRAPRHIIPMQRSGADWGIKIKGEAIGEGLFYLYQARGNNEVSADDQYGLMFNENYFLNDPYSYKTQNVRYSSFFSDVPLTDISSPVYTGGGKSIVCDHFKDPHPGHVRIDPEDLIVYELHVQDYTARIPELDPFRRGTYAGLTKGGLRTPGGLSAGIDHLVELGITAVELMPVMEYDEETGNVEGRYNHWGYMTTNFFSPEARYASVEGKQIEELKQLVAALHERGFAVFMDVVFNHTGEQGPWIDRGCSKLAAKYFNFMGLSNTHVYRPTFEGNFYMNNSGTGNDICFSGPDDTFAKKVVNDSLAMWYEIYGIDGFRFDLARILADGSHSAADWIDNDPRFRRAHLHAEPWDLGGQWLDFMDNFGWNHGNNRWAKWVGRYRDKIRRFSASGLKHRAAFKQLVEGFGSVSELMGRVASTKPWRSINFLAVHDGYTLRDCVWFNDAEDSHNCWDSGGSEDLRRQREKLMMGILLTSQGVPLILQGDEFGRTKSSALSQSDTHNTYNYESTSGNIRTNHVNWIDWQLKDGDNSQSPNGPTYGRELFNWTKDLIALRKKWSHFRRRDFAQYVDGAWNHGSNAGAANDGKFSYSWEGPGDGEPTQLAVLWWGEAGEPDIMVIYNEHWESFSVTNLRDWSQGDWRVLARSWYEDSGDFIDVDQWEAQCDEAGSEIAVKGRSMAILISDND